MRLAPRRSNIQYGLPVSFQARGVALTKSFYAAARRIITSALGRFQPRIRSVAVWLDDVNGPRGGIDTRCRLDVQLVPHGRISVSSMGRDPYTATAQAAAQARESIDRRVKKTRDTRRRLVRA